MPVLHAHLWYLLLGVWHTKVGNRVLTLFEERRAAVLFCLHFGAKKCNKNALAHAIMQDSQRCDQADLLCCKILLLAGSL